MILASFHWAKHIWWHGGNLATRSVGGTSVTQTPCELYSILRINPYNWTFPNCNISFIMDQSTNKTTNEWLLQVAYGKTCSTLGALLLFAWQQNHSVGCTKREDRHTVGRSCLFWSSVFATICPLNNNIPIFRHFDDVLNLCINSFFLFFFNIRFFFVLVSLLCFLLLLLLSIFLGPDEGNFLSKALVFLCVSSYRWIYFPSSDLSVLSTSPVVVHSFLRKRMFSFIFRKSHG